MAIPSADMDIEDGAFGSLPPNTSGASVKLGVCSRGVPNTFQGYSDTKAMERVLGRGPLVEAAALVLATSGGPVYPVPVNPSIAGSVGSVTHEGTGAGTITPSLAPDRAIQAKVSTAGALGTAKMQFRIFEDGAWTQWSSPVDTTAGPWSYRVPTTLSVLTFPAGTYVINETYLWSVLGALTFRNAADDGAGTGPSGATQASSPIDAYRVLIDIMTSGAPGAGAFSYSLDGGASFSAPIAIPSGTKYAIPDAGVVLTFASAFEAGDTYAFDTVAAGFTVSDVNNAWDAIQPLAIDWDHAHVVGTPANVAAAITLATALQLKMKAAETQFRFTYGVVECPTSESDATLIAAAASFAGERVVIAAGDADIMSPITLRLFRRNAAWAITARIAQIPVGEDPAWVGRGNLTGVRKLYRDESLTPGLDEARFATLRTHRGLPGYYVTNGRTMASPGSDFWLVQFRRLMDKACEIARGAELPYLSGSVRITSAGKIDERDAQQFEGTVNAKLRAGVVASGDASDSSVVLDRSANILAGADAPVTVRVTPLGYLKHLKTNIGFTNPANAL